MSDFITTITHMMIQIILCIMITMIDIICMRNLLIQADHVSIGTISSSCLHRINPQSIRILLVAILDTILCNIRNRNFNTAIKDIQPMIHQIILAINRIENNTIATLRKSGKSTISNAFSILIEELIISSKQEVSVNSNDALDFFIDDKFLHESNTLTIPIRSQIRMIAIHVDFILIIRIFRYLNARLLVVSTFRNYDIGRFVDHIILTIEIPKHLLSSHILTLLS